MFCVKFCFTWFFCRSSWEYRTLLFIKTGASLIHHLSPSLFGNGGVMRIEPVPIGRLSKLSRTFWTDKNHMHAVCEVYSFSCTVVKVIVLNTIASFVSMDNLVKPTLGIILGQSVGWIDLIIKQKKVFLWHLASRLHFFITRTRDSFLLKI